MNHLGDAQLVAQAIEAADHAAFGELVRRYQGRVYALAYSICGDWTEAQDLAQESFIRAFSNLRELREPEKFAAWLRQIAFRMCMDSLRATHRVRIDAANDFDELINESGSPVDLVEQIETRERDCSLRRADIPMRRARTLRVNYPLP